jgi:hypothetical protein
VSTENKHEYYELLNLIGYGLSKFNYDFVKAYGFKTKTDFYNYIVKIGIAKTTGTVKNRQDLFDGMVSGGERKGWWQKGQVYRHRKDYIDSFLGHLQCNEYVDIVKLSVAEALGGLAKDEITKTIKVSPIIRSSFRQMQQTGKEAEHYFINNYHTIEIFADASIADARLLGDGYDFQLTLAEKYVLAEVKGLKHTNGEIRMTQREYEKAIEYKNDYVLIIVRNLIESPAICPIFNPINNLHFEKRRLQSEQVNYHSKINERIKNGIY